MYNEIDKEGNIMKNAYLFLKITIGCVIGVFVGTSIYQCVDYSMHKDLYMLTSAPWYLSIQINALFTIVIVTILLVIMYILKKKSY